MNTDLGRSSLGLGRIPEELRPPENVQALLFDCDGTLVDTLALYRSCWTVVFGARGFELTDEWFETWRGHTMVPFLLAALPDLTPDELVAVEREGLDMFFERAHELEAFEHIVDIARQFHGRVPIAVVSGGPRDAVERTLEATGLDELFDLVVTNTDVVNGKPAPDVYLLAMERLGVDAAHCIAYEDSASGLASARAAGIAHVRDVRTNEISSTPTTPGDTMFDYSAEMFHVGYLVPDIHAAMADLGPSLNLNWTQVISRDDQPCWTPERGAFTCPLTFAYSTEGPQRVELIQGVAGTVWDHGGSGHLHHAGVWCDVPALTDSLINQGWELIAAQKAPEDGYGSFTYVRSPSGFLLEPVTLSNKERMERWFAGGSL